MNERNLKALTSLLLDADGPHYPIAQLLAEHLSRRGVLVPSALTDEDTARLYDKSSDYDYIETAEETYRVKVRGNPQQMRDALERIAKGEDP